MPSKSKAKSGKNNKSKNKTSIKRELILKEEGQDYGQVLRMLGNGRLEVLCTDGKKRLALIRGTMRKKVWIAQGDCVLVGMRDFQEDRVDVIHKYNPDETRQLNKMGEIDFTAQQTDDGQQDGEQEDNNSNIVFEVDDI